MQRGTIVAERFEIERLAGAGGMGSVYRAHDRLTGEPVAVKVLRGADERAASRFALEARVLGELRHPGIVRYVAHGTTPAGDMYLAMQWLEGEDLAARLARSPLTFAEVIELAVRAAEALGAAHRRGVVHRDVKPANLFLVDGDVARTKVLDFGVARFRAAPNDLTLGGAAVGTPSYMAPEQVRASRELDARADVFALGCVLYRCIAGRAPFVGDDPAAIASKVLNDEVAPLRDVAPSVPPSLDFLVARMLSKDPRARPADGAEVAAELASLTTVDHVASVGSTERALGTDENRPVAVVVVRADADASARVKEIARKHGAHVEIDDAAAAPSVLGFVGSIAAIDLASRAARCALELRDTGFSVRIAIATGRGLVRDGATTGDAVQRASTLCDAAAVGSIVLDELAAALLAGRFDVGSDLVLRAERSSTRTGRTLLGKPTPFVGRERDLARCESFVDESEGESVARVVVVTAPPGVGKSRLREELVERVRARSAGWTILFGWADPVRVGSPYALVAHALREAAQVRDDDRPQLRHLKLRARIGRSVAPEEIARIAHFLGEIANAPSNEPDAALAAAKKDPMLMGDQVRRAFEDFIDAETKRAPVLFVLEDLQFGDLPSVQLLDGVLRKLVDRPLVVVAFARPEVDELFPRLWSERGAQTMRLGELTKRAGEKLVRGVLGDDVARETIDRIVARSAGNAFFLEELVRAVAEGRGDSLPDTVLAMAQARLLDLDPEERRVLRAASVFGEDFTGESVVPLLGGDRSSARLDAWLSTLVEREVLVRRADEDAFAFRHALLRDAAYAMLTDEDRALGHRLAAGWLEKRERPDPNEIAEHLERGGARDRAIAWWLHAAEESLEANDFVGAVSRAERGVACGAQGELLGELRAVQASAHKWRGAHAEQETHAQQAVALLPAGSNAWCSAVADLIGASDVANSFERVFALENELKTIARRDGGTRPLLMAWLRAALSVVFAGGLDHAAASVQEIADLAAQATPHDALVFARLESVRASLALAVGDIGRAVDHFESASRLFLRGGDLRNGVTARMNLAYTMVMTGRPEEAAVVLRAALADCDRMGLGIVRKTVLGNLAFALGRCGAYDEGRAMAEEAAEAGRRQGDPRTEGNARVYLAAILGWIGSTELAEKEAFRAVELLKDNPPYRPAAHAMLARILLANGRKEEADVHSRIAHDELEARGGAEHKEYIRLARAEILRAIGDDERAKEVIALARARLLEDAERIADLEVRKRFLERVPENARTLKLARQWCDAR